MQDLLVAELKRQNRLLKQMLFLVSIAGTSLVLLATKSADLPHTFKEINVERINVVMPNGNKEMVISNRLRIPPPVVDGKEAMRDGDARPGIIFYNALGDENGGLIFDGKLDKNGKPSAGMHFSMDRFGGDQQLALGQYESDGFMESGLSIFDRGLNADYIEYQNKIEKMSDGPEKLELIKKWEAAGGKQTKRMFVGKTKGKSSAIILADNKGAPRIMMVVTPEGKASLEFLDDQGKVIQSLPEVKNKEVR